jgi:hypothetical protein
MTHTNSQRMAIGILVDQPNSSLQIAKPYHYQVENSPIEITDINPTLSVGPPR